MNYRIYGFSYTWEHLITVYTEEQVEEYIDCITYSEYNVVMVIRHNIKLNMDEPYLLKELDIMRRKLER